MSYKKSCKNILLRFGAIVNRTTIVGTYLGITDASVLESKGGGGTGKSDIHSVFFFQPARPPSIYSNFGHVDMFSTTIIFYIQSTFSYCIT